MSIFKSIIDKTGGARKSGDWYRNMLFSELVSVQSTLDNPDDGVNDDDIVEPGEMYFFAYAATQPQKLKYYDMYPCTYVIELLDDGFIGSNLHYLFPKIRGPFAQSLINNNNGVNVPNKTIHRYNYGGILSQLFRVPSTDYNVSVLPTQKFIDRKGIVVPNHKVWRK